MRRNRYDEFGNPVPEGTPLPDPTTLPGVTLPPPSYEDIINGDPIFMGQKNSLTSQGIASAAERAAAIRRALIDYGMVPDFSKLGLSQNTLGFLNTDVTPDIAGLAGDATKQGLSLMARMQKQHEQNLQGIDSNLAARGIYHSGDLGRLDTQEAQSFKQGTYDSQKSLLDLINGVISSFTQGENARQGELSQDATAAAARAQAQMGSQTPHAPGLMWGGQYWASGQRNAFAKWLRAHGVDYAHWAASHPGAASIFG